MATNGTQSQGVEELGEQWTDEQSSAYNAYVVWRMGEGPIPPQEMWQHYAPNAQEILRQASQDESQKVA